MINLNDMILQLQEKLYHLLSSMLVLTRGVNPLIPHYGDVNVTNYKLVIN